jgi:hypothetical protein
MRVRNAFAGCAPLFFYEANNSRVGKGLLTNIVAIGATGRQATRTPFCENDELRKKITATIVAGNSYVLLDNVKGKFGGPVLEQALTATWWSDRLLGASRVINLPLTMTFLATGNNAVLSHDMVGRTCRCRMESPLENPGERTEFRHASLVEYVTGRQKELAMAAIAIPSAYLKAGSPTQAISGWGGFEAWNCLVRASMVWSGLPDLDTRASLADDTDDDSDELQTLMDAWTFGDMPLRIKDAIQLSTAGKHETFAAYLKTLKGDPETQLRYMLRDSRGRVLNGKRFVCDGKKVKMWRLVPA